MPHTQVRPKRQRPVGPPGMGAKNTENVRVRNRRFKIKRMMAQPKNIEVLKLRKMVEYFIEW